ncbi:endonuclease/exonuclease/phosphatase family protein [Brachybacterium massiliense]|uniref:endonuclease/exonuclease/phosphatase family protein n=1 Tax=Brachybacterium massiliense TaxID=1755098 RepID=UPI0011228D9E|nr:endonuclease/exonuclease/phosphatase family protein [Brachybacterium massiliense]
MSTAPRTGYQDRHPLIGPARQDHLHVMTFNLRYDNSSATAVGEPDHWPERRPLMIDLLAREQPTLLGVQEALFGQLDALREALPGHSMIGYGREGGSAGEHSALLYDPSRLRIRQWDQFWLSDTPQLIGSTSWGNRITRIVVWARMEDLATGRELAMITTHLDHESEPARVRSAQALIDLLGSSALKGLPTLVTGDFNSPAHSSGAYTALVTGGPFRDTWDAAQQRLTPAWGTFPNYREPVEGGERIDWVLATEEFTVLEAAINPGADSRGRFPSDHAAVQARVALR